MIADPVMFDRVFSFASCGRSSAFARVSNRSESAVEIAAGLGQPVASGRLS